MQIFQSVFTVAAISTMLVSCAEPKVLRGTQALSFVAQKCGEDKGVEGVSLQAAGRKNNFKFDFPEGTSEADKREITICASKKIEAMIARQHSS